MYAIYSHPLPPSLCVCPGCIGKRQYGDLANLSWLKEHAKELSQQQQFMAAGSGGFDSGGGENGTACLAALDCDRAARVALRSKGGDGLPGGG